MHTRSTAAVAAPALSSRSSRTPLLALLALLFVGAMSSASQAGEAVNTDKTGVAINGYDPVAYFTDGKPVKGDFQNASTVDGATYWFASADHKKLFEANPQKYLPQFGGYCAFGVSIGKKFNADPSVWKIIDGKLYLNLNAAIGEKFAVDTAAKLKAADAAWPAIKDVPAGQIK
jgi:YHS domain-containing protein